MSELEINRDEQQARVTVDAVELETVHLPVLHDLEKRWRARRGRLVVLLGGPPGSGKTTLAGVWERLAERGLIGLPVQSLPMDGFHYPNRVLDAQRITIDGVEMPLRHVKGRPETFDLPMLRQSLHALKAGQPVFWPAYDRTVHDPVPGVIPVPAEGILVVEGMYVLLDAPGWRDLRAQSDYGVFLECSEEMLRADLLSRKCRQGRSYPDAAAHYDLVDHYSWQLTAQFRHGIDALIRVGPGRRLELAAVNAHQAELMNGLAKKCI